MSRRANSFPSNQRRSGDMNSFGLVQDALSKCNIHLESIAQRLANNQENLPGDIIDQWKEKSLSLAKSTTVVRQKDADVRDVVSGLRRKEDIIGPIEVDHMKQEIESKTTAIDFANDRSFQIISEILYHHDDADVAVVRTEATELEFRCPYTGLKFEEPMKRYDQNFDLRVY